MKTPTKFSSLELFSGSGGLALGFEKAGFNTLGLIDSNKDCVETIKNNRPDWNIIHADVANIDYSQFKNVDVIAGGFPCQSFSLAGNGLGFEDKRGNLFFEMMRPIKELKPKIFLAENVAGLLYHNKGKSLNKILNTLENVGYKTHYQLLNAFDFGVPQKRKRLIILASKDCELSAIPTPKISKRVLKDVLLDCPPSDGMKYSLRKKEILDLVPAGGCWTSLPKEIQREYMGASYGSHSSLGGRRGIARRLSFEEPSLTILCSPAQKQTERCHPTETRPFTIRESARIQSFPDDWFFHGSLVSQYRQIGNAVPVLFATYIAEHIKKLLSCEFNLVR